MESLLRIRLHALLAYRYSPPCVPTPSLRKKAKTADVQYKLQIGRVDGKGETHLSSFPLGGRFLMTRPVARLEIGRMTNRAILDYALNRLFCSRWLYIHSIKEQDKLLDQVKQCIEELKLRGDQLQLPSEDH
jgi:hypothetical protein